MANKKQIVVTEMYDEKEYDEFINNNANASVFQTRYMAEVYEKYADTEPLILIAKNEDSNEILASMLVKKMQEKKGFLSSFSLHSTIRGGPIFKNDEDGVKATSLLIQEYDKNIANKWAGLYTRIHPLSNAEQLVPSYQNSSYEYSGWNNFLINLNIPLSDVWGNLEKSARKNVNRADKKGLYIEEITEKCDIPQFYELLFQNYNSRKQPLEDISYFKDIFDILVPKGIAKFFVAKFEDKWAAVRLVLAYKGIVYDWYTAASSEHLSFYPNDLMIWHILKWGTENGYHTFDFGGGGTPEQGSEGWVRFKKKFGGTPVNYGRYTKIHNPKQIWIAKKGFDIYKKIKYH